MAFESNGANTNHVNRSLLSFDDLTLREEPVRIAGQWYVLREASEGAVCQYRNEGIRAARFDAEGHLSSMDGAANTEPLLVSLCLFYTIGEGPLPDGSTGAMGTLQVRTGPPKDTPINVPLHTVKGWPGRIVQKLFDRAKELSELNEGYSDREEIVRMIESLQKRLEELDAKEAQDDGDGEGTLKNVPDGTTGSST